jgi:hypothetical protein
VLLLLFPLDCRGSPDSWGGAVELELECGRGWLGGLSVIFGGGG